MDYTNKEEYVDNRASVVVPSYNHAQFIERCLRSIFNQTLPPFKLLVIDDGSKDDSVKIIERILKDAPFNCELIARSNRGLCATLNEGFDLTSGNYFAYLGSDDFWLPEFLEYRIRTLESRPNALLCFGHAYIINEKDQITDCTADWANYVDGNVQRMLLSDIGPISSSVVYKRSALEHHKWNELSKLEDYELYLQLSLEGDFAFDPRILSAWRVHENNTSGHTIMFIEEIIKAQNKLIEKFNLSYEEFKDIQAKLKFRCAEHYIKNGLKLKAINLIKYDLKRAPSISSYMRIVAGLLIPHKILLWRKHLLQSHAVKRHGSVKL
jgi:alpha-1,3-rhamnosyltransferase